jgi:DNA-binding protein HU-beta
VNKADLVQKLAKVTDLTQAKAAEVVDAIFETTAGQGIIAAELDAGRDVSIYGFGKFGSKSRAARTGRNPATGATITIAAKKYPTFQAAKGLKDRIAK